MPPKPNPIPLAFGTATVSATRREQREQRMPMRTSKLGTKLKVLPGEHPDNDDGTGTEVSIRVRKPTDEGEGEYYTPLHSIPAGSARRDALRLTKAEKAKLPRLTAYCTAASYDLPALQTYLSNRPAAYHTHPRVFDTECLHTPYLPQASSSRLVSMTRRALGSPTLGPRPSAVPEGDLLNLDGYAVNAPPGREEQKRRPGFAKRPGGLSRRKPSSSGSVHGDEDVGGSDTENDDDFEEEEWVPDVFLFEYGTVVIWGMTEKEERAFLKSISEFEMESLNIEDEEVEELNFYYADYSRIYNDVITLRKGSSYMTKLALSHALSQSVKISLFEELISGTIEQSKDIPKSLSETGDVGLPPTEIMKQIGYLFILRININLVGANLDSPEFFWSYPDLEPLYNACRTYLEIEQRVDLLNARVDILQDMLKLLKGSANNKHGERLELTVILLIAFEIVVGIFMITIDVIVR